MTQLLEQVFRKLGCLPTTDQDRIALELRTFLFESTLASQGVASSVPRSIQVLKRFLKIIEGKIAHSKLWG